MDVDVRAAYGGGGSGVYSVCEGHRRSAVWEHVNHSDSVQKVCIIIAVQSAYARRIDPWLQSVISKADGEGMRLAQGNNDIR